MGAEERESECGREFCSGVRMTGKKKERVGGKDGKIRKERW